MKPMFPLKVSVWNPVIESSSEKWWIERGTQTYMHIKIPSFKYHNFFLKVACIHQKNGRWQHPCQHLAYFFWWRWPTSKKNTTWQHPCQHLTYFLMKVGNIHQKNPTSKMHVGTKQCRQIFVMKVAGFHHNWKISFYIACGGFFCKT